MNINIKRMEETFQFLSQFGATAGGGINRPALSDADKMARDTFCKWLYDAGLDVRVDDAGNIYGIREGIDNSLNPVMMGSHLDTVYNGGRFDGITGVQSALEVIRTLNDNHTKTKRPVGIVVFTNEEGARFEPALLGSGILTGKFKKEDVYKTTDRDNIAFGDELERIGYKGAESNRLKQADTYLEMHVEQGPVLDNEGISLGVLNGIQGMVWLELTVQGQADHAGPSPMETRKDSLVGAAAMITEINKIAFELGNGTTTTVGKIRVKPEVINVIAGETTFSLDIRNEDDAVIDRAIQMIQERTEKICAESGLKCTMKEFWRVDAIAFDKEVVNIIEDAVITRGYTYKKMVSGAGHDASYMSQAAPTAMIFVPSIGGKSHCEEELSYFPDIERGINILLDTVLARANR